MRTLCGRWYHWISSILVDEDVNEKTRLTIVRFGSDAHFELVDTRAAIDVLVLVGTDKAVLVSMTQGMETLSDKQREQIGLIER